MKANCLAFLMLFVSVLFGIAAAQPNIVIIMVDDLGYGDVGYQGGNVPTPHIDSLARGGVIFTDGYVTCPVCAPSRAGLLTGCYQQRLGFWDNIGPYRISADTIPGIPADLPILPERLKKLGYTSGLFGKTHDGAAEAMMAFNRWDEFYGFNNGASNYLGDMNRPHNPIFHNRKIVSSPYLKRGIKHRDVCRNGVIIKDSENYLTDRIAEMAVSFIAANKDRQFLCYIPFNAIHGPFQVPKSLIDKYAHIRNDKRRKVMAMVESLDNNVGRVLEALKQYQLLENTMIVFLSDNGGHEASPNRPLRGKKGTYWEGGLRVPFCLRWDGHVKPGQTYTHPVISLDIMPTVMTAAGAAIDPTWKLDGVDLLPYITGKNTGRPHDTLHWVWGPKKAIREGDMKAVSMDGGKTYLLFDLAKDIGEQNDLAKKNPETLRGLIKKHQKWEATLTPQKWGWNKKLGYKDPGFGKLRPYHGPAYAAAQAEQQNDGTADEVTTLNVKSKLPFVDRTKFVVKGTIAYRIPEKRNDGLEVGDAREYGDLTKILKLLNEIEQKNQDFRVGQGVKRQVKDKWGPQVEGCIDSVLIAKDGKLILEEYFADARVDRPHYQMSITKSILAYAIGKTIELGKIKSDGDLILDYLPEVDRSKIAVGVEKLTIKDLLTMCSGIRIEHGRQKTKITRENHAELYLTQTQPIPMEKPYKYDGANPDILAHILYNTTGMTLGQFAGKYLFAPLGITNFKFGKSACGLDKAAAGMNLTSRDMLKIGLMTTHGGVWHGRQILERKWIEKATAVHANHDKPHQYGYFWWSHTITHKGKEYRVRSARGAGGQFIFMLPEFDLVAVFTSYYATNIPIQYFGEIIVPALCP